MTETATPTIAEAAHAEIVRLCNGGQWRMHIPVNPTDSDIVLSAAVDALDRVIALTNSAAMFEAMYGAATDPDGRLGLSALAAANAVRDALTEESA